ncbi:MAG: Lytic transglycosylase catalytic [Deltaproteobacteria bacterium]|nr:Lytic transglycosylase catalytic [Deltaproteobacteria bacterium]
MRHSLYLVLLGLLLLVASCAQHSAQVRPAEPPKSDAPSQAVQVATEEVKPAPKPEPATRPLPLWSPREDKTCPLPAEPSKASSRSGQALAKAEKSTKDAAHRKDDPETEQRKIEEALDLYQEGVDAWSRGEWAEAIQAFDESFQIIYSIDADNDPEIAQQKEDLRLLISKRIVEIYASRSHLHTDLSGEIPLAMNDHVAREIRSFQTVERDFFIDSYYRSGMYRPYIAAQMKKAGLPEDLSWLPLIESGFKVKALSRARALGLWQFIASTGYRFDLRRDRWVDERMDLERSTDGAINYLTTLHDLFGDWTTVLAAYNCGEANVLRVIRQQHVNYLDNFWDLYQRLPAETARYVPRFLASLHIIKNPAKYGFTDLQLAPSLVYEKVPIDKQVRLPDIAQALSLSVEAIYELNPALRNGVTPDYAYTLNVHNGHAPLLLAKLDEIPRWQPPKITCVRHRVRPGESLASIARKYRVSQDRILEASGLQSAKSVRRGQVLQIPREGRVVTAGSESQAKSAQAALSRKASSHQGAKGTQTVSRSTPAGAEAAQRTAAPDNPTPGTAVHPGRAEANSPRTVAAATSGTSRENGTRGQTVAYRVKDGDTLFSIAKRFNTSVDQIKVLNALKSNLVKVGQLIHVPKAAL